jgi:hypothetical protein
VGTCTVLASSVGMFSRRLVAAATVAVSCGLTASSAAQDAYEKAPIPPEWVAPDPSVAAPAAPAAPAASSPAQASPPHPAPAADPVTSSPPLAAAPAPGTSKRPPPLRTEPYSKPMMIGGGVTAGLGAFLLLFGGFSATDDTDGSPHTLASAILGGAFVLGGTPFLIIGAHSVPVEEGAEARRPPPLAPRVRLSATSASATWRF